MTSRDTGRPIAGVTVVVKAPPKEYADVTDARGELTVKLVHLGSGEILSMSLLKIDEALLG